MGLAPYHSLHRTLNQVYFESIVGRIRQLG
jgi:hypothetical protein